MTPTKYNELNELLAQFSDLSSALQIVEADINRSQIEAARPLLPNHAIAKAKLADIEDKLRGIAVGNPDLFPGEKKTHATPFGSVSFRTSTSLEIKDEEKTILKIKVACQKEAMRAQAAKEQPRFTEDMLLRKREEPNVEALEQFEDGELVTLFGVARVTEEKFSVKPLEVKADKLAKGADASGAGGRVRKSAERVELN